MRFILLFLLLFTFNIQSKECPFNTQTHKIACHIVKNKPNINLDYAMKLSNAIYKAAKKYDLNPLLLSAIFAQESLYRLDAIGSYTGLRKPSDAELLDLIADCTASLSEEEYKIEVLENDNVKCLDKAKNTLIKDKIIMDFSISQIYYRTAERYGFDLTRLTTDLEYAVNAGARVLSDFKKRYSKNDIFWWSRYNSPTPTKRKIYQTLVERYL